MNGLNNSMHPENDIIKSGLFFRNSLKILKNPLAFLTGSVTNNGPVVKLNLGRKKYYLIQEPSFVKRILVDDINLYQKTTGHKLVRSFLGEGISAVNGEAWAKQRRTISPAFHRQKLEHMAETINKETTSFLERLTTLNDNAINFTNEFFHLTMSITGQTLFHATPVEIDQLVKVMGDMKDYASKWMRNPVKIPINWPTRSNRQYLKNVKTFDELVYGLINRRKTERAAPNYPGYNDLLDMLMDQQVDENVSASFDKSLRDEITVFLVAGHETSTHTLSWIVYHLAKDKNILSEIRRESELIMGNDLPTYENISKLDYTRKVVHETLRSYPPFWLIARQNRETVVLNGMQIPAGSTLLINIYGLHHHPAYWDQPDIYYPSRFDPELDSQRPSYVFMPFGAGPRSCIGHNFAMMEILIVINRIARTFDLEIPTGYVAEVEPNITLKARGGIQLTVRKR